jgi:GT2 family glycosyltransferase
MVDNSSSDESVAYVQQYFPWVKIIANFENTGYAKANNDAIKQAKGEYCLFLNMDTWVKSDLLEALMSEVVDNPKIGICACTQLSYDGKEKLNIGMGIDIIAYPFIPRNTEQIFYADGASLFIKKSVFLELQGFDSQYFMYAEDVDLCWRALLAGYDVAAVPSAIIGHKSAGTFVLAGAKEYQLNLSRRYLAERNSFRSLLKNYSTSSLLYVLPLRIGVTIQEIIVFITRKPEFAVIEVKAILWNLKNLRGTLALRRTIQKSRRVSDKGIIRKMTKNSSIARSITAIFQGNVELKWNQK